MSSIGDVNANELLNLDLVDLESCFDPLFYPSEDFEKESLPYILKRLIFSNRNLSPNTVSLSKNFSAKEADW